MFHTIKIPGGGVRRDKKGRSGQSIYRPAKAHRTRKKGLLAARCERICRRFVPPPDPVRLSAPSPFLLPDARFLHPRAKSASPPAKSMYKSSIHSKATEFSPKLSPPKPQMPNSSPTCSKMGRQSKRACAPTPMEVPSPGNQPVAPPGNQPVTQPLPPQFVVPSSFASTYRPGALFPAVTTQSMAPSSAPCWFTMLQQPGMTGSSTQGPWLFSTGIGPSTENAEHPDIHALYDTVPLFSIFLAV